MKFTHWFVQLLLGLPKFPGRDFLIVKLPKWFIKEATSSSIVNTRFGFKIKVDPTFDQNIENVIYERGVYELGTLSILLSYLKPGNTFIDVGANIGFLSLSAAAIVGKQGEVLAFEPHPDTFKILEENKALNQFSQLQLHQKGMGERHETVMIYSEENNRGGASISNKRSNEGVEIEIETLDDLVLSRKVDMIKIDVEGYELKVLKGGRALLEKDRPVLILEFSNERVNEEDPVEMYNWLNDLNIYDFYKLKRGKERRSKLMKIENASSLPSHDNLICLPINN